MGARRFLISYRASGARRLLTAATMLGVLTVFMSVPPAGAVPKAVPAAQAAPSPRGDTGLAYDAATSQVVLFGGDGPTCCTPFDDTWTWDGTGWTEQHPAHSPPPRSEMGLAYDPAHNQVVLFGGGDNESPLGDTWVWNGTDWTLLHPAHSPPARAGMGLAYDAARGQVVLFGGTDLSEVPGYFGGTWTWNGTDWTKRTPVHSPSPRSDMGMAYDSVRHKIVLFGGQSDCCALGDTWTWNGTDWIKRAPAHKPSPRSGVGMSRNHVMLFGCDGSGGLGRETWTWDGADWTRRDPASKPPLRCFPGMAYDAAGAGAVLFGGFERHRTLADTWTWSGSNWVQHLAGSLSVDPQSGAPGAIVKVQGWGFASDEIVELAFLDSTEGRTVLGWAATNATGAFKTRVTTPSTATPGNQHVSGKGMTSGQTATVVFTVT